MSEWTKIVKAFLVAMGAMVLATIVKDLIVREWEDWDFLFIGLGVFFIVRGFQRESD